MNHGFGPINPNPNYPNWQARLIRPAIQSYRDKSYEEIAQLLAPDFTFNEKQIEDFSKAVTFKVRQMKTRVAAIKRIMRDLPYYPYRYRDENALDSFQRWAEQLEPFTSLERARSQRHHVLCKDNRCLRYRCNFHQTNAEASLAVYRSDFDVIRNPRTGLLVEVAIFVPRT